MKRNGLKTLEVLPKNHDDLLNLHSLQSELFQLRNRNCSNPCRQLNFCEITRYRCMRAAWDCKNIASLRPMPHCRLHVAAYRCHSRVYFFASFRSEKAIVLFHSHRRSPHFITYMLVCKHMCHPIHKSRRCAPQYISTSLTASGAARERGSRPDRHG